MPLVVPPVLREGLGPTAQSSCCFSDEGLGASALGSGLGRGTGAAVVELVCLYSVVQGSFLTEALIELRIILFYKFFPEHCSHKRTA